MKKAPCVNTDQSTHARDPEHRHGGGYHTIIVVSAPKIKSILLKGVRSNERTDQVQQGSGVSREAL